MGTLERQLLQAVWQWLSEIFRVTSLGRRPVVRADRYRPVAVIRSPIPNACSAAIAAYGRPHTYSHFPASISHSARLQDEGLRDVRVPSGEILQNVLDLFCPNLEPNSYDSHLQNSVLTGRC